MADRILVTGGAGYVGSACVARLVEKGDQVVVYDNLSTGHRRAVTGGATLEVGDLADQERLSGVFRSFEPDSVMHFAASCLLGESFREPALYYRNNVVNGLNLLEAMLDCGVQSMIFSSSCAVYGEPRRIPIAEDHPRDPVNPYGKTKLAFEHLLEDCRAAYGMRSVCLRYFNAAGATELLGEDHRQETHLIPNILRAVLGTGPGVKVFGDDYPTEDGTCVRDYVHVSDLAEAHVKALDLLRQGISEKINLGNGDGFSVLEAIKVAQKITGRDIPYQIAPRREGDPAALVASSAKAERVLGWRPAYSSLEEIVETAWKWHSQHPDGYSSG